MKRMTLPNYLVAASTQTRMHRSKSVQKVTLRMEMSHLSGPH